MTLKLPIDLSNREAKCPYSDTIVPSSSDLPFFEYKGEGSFQAEQSCKNCHYYKIAHIGHQLDPRRTTCKCDNFEPHGPFEYDSYYCGCRGWD